MILYIYIHIQSSCVRDHDEPIRIPPHIPPSLAADTARPWSALVTPWSHRWHRRPPQSVAVFGLRGGSPMNLELGTVGSFRSDHWIMIRSHVIFSGSQTVGAAPHRGHEFFRCESWSEKKRSSSCHHWLSYWDRLLPVRVFHEWNTWGQPWSL